MSKDIRSYFTSLSKKTGITKTDSNKEKSSKISKDDIIPDTPDKSTKHNKANENKTKRKRIVNISSDSDSETDKVKKPAKTPKKEPVKNNTKTKITSPAKKPVVSPNKQTSKKIISPLEAFGNTVVKQEKVVKKNLEVNIHDDDDFDKTLLELDEDELLKSVDKSTNCSETVDIKKETHDVEDNKVNASNKKENIKIKDENDSTDTEKVTKETPTKKTPSRKRKKSENQDESTSDPDQDRYEKKRYSAMLYQKFLQRGGPAHLGAKWIPKGKPDCLKNLCFIITGVLDSLEREQAETLIKEHGGRCTHSVSGKVNYMVLGEDAGPAKLEKARKLGTKIISEDDLIELICAKSGIHNQNKQESTNETKIESPIKPKEIIKKENSPQNKKAEKLIKEKDKPIEQDTKIEKDANKKDDTNKKSPAKSKAIKKESIPAVKEPKKEPVVQSLAWVDKFKPTDVNQIIGQQGERSNVKKLMNWLNNWHKNRVRESSGKGIPRPSPWAKDDDGAYFRAALLSGPPGVGKTTTATLVCKELGYDTVEFNASDTRNKRMVHDEISQIIKTTSIAGFFQSGSAPNKKHVLLMDEVDGMSGNEDRGGMQELINMIKISNIPIICMCNDRQHPKIRTLANYCFDLRFSKPRLEQIRGAMMSICFKQGIKIKPEILTHIIQGTGQDIRQTLNQLSLWSTTAVDEVSTVAKEAKSTQKDIKLGPWEVIRKVFSEEEHKTMTLADKSKLFFHDYSIGPLFVQENYLKVIPHCPKKEQLKRFADAADAISMGDVVDARIRSSQNWSLLEMQAMYASVLPGHYLEGHFGGQIDFPGWLGKNSKANKFQRMLSEINVHTRMSISGDRTAVGLDYVRSLRDAIVYPMAKNGSDGIQDSIAVMRSYNLLREDLTNLIELSHWPKLKDPFDSIDSKVKAAFTRTYNKEGPVLPYAAPGAGAVKSKRGAAATALDDEFGEYGEEDAAADDSNDDDNINNDAMIKAKKPSSTKAASSSSKGKAPAKTRGTGRRGNKK